MDMRPSDNLERMRGLLSRMERAVDSARDRRQGVTPAAGPVQPLPGVNAIPTASSSPAHKPAPSMERRQAEPPPASFPFPAAVPSGKPKARAKSLEEFDEAFKRLASRQAS